MHDDFELDGRLERALDAALATYSEAEPSPDLPRRILDRAANQAQQNARKGLRTGRAARRPAWVWAASLATAAVLLVALVLAQRFAVAPLPLTVASRPGAPAFHMAAPPAPIHKAYRTLAAQPQPVSLPRSRTAAARPVKIVKAVLTGPRPLPAPYSPEELVMVAFVEQHPKEAQEAQEAARRDAEPLHEEPLHEQPLVTPPVQIDPIAPDTLH